MIAAGLQSPRAFDQRINLAASQEVQIEQKLDATTLRWRTDVKLKIESGLRDMLPWPRKFNTSMACK